MDATGPNDPPNGWRWGPMNGPSRECRVPPIVLIAQSPPHPCIVRGQVSKVTVSSFVPVCGELLWLDLYLLTWCGATASPSEGLHWGCCLAFALMRCRCPSYASSLLPHCLSLTSKVARSTPPPLSPQLHLLLCGHARVMPSPRSLVPHPRRHPAHPPRADCVRPALLREGGTARGDGGAGG